jgi:hypothetical protein
MSTKNISTEPTAATKINLDQIEALAKAGTPGLCDPQTILALAERIAELEQTVKDLLGTSEQFIEDDYIVPFDGLKKAYAALGVSRAEEQEGGAE